MIEKYKNIVNDFKNNKWKYIDYLFIGFALFLFCSSFPLHEWDWGFTSKKLEITLLICALYLGIKADIRKDISK